jgi:predicted porin
MRQLLLATSALALLAVATPALADDFSVRVGGYVRGYLEYIDQDVNGALTDDRDFVASSESEMHLVAKNIFDDGFQLGFRTEIRLWSDNRPPTDDDNTVDEVSIFADFIYGKIEFGLNDGAADQLHIREPQVSRSHSINDPRVFNLIDPTNRDVQLGSDNDGHIVATRTDMYLGEDNTKVIITSPRIVGFQAAVSFMPEYDESFDGFGSRSSDDPRQQSEMLELAANYIGSLGDVDLSAYGAFQSASIESPSGGEDDLDTWGAGANVKFEGLTVGGSFLSTNAFANRLRIEPAFTEGRGITGNGGAGVDDDFTTTVWAAGATYAYDAFIFGVNYVDGSAERPLLPDVESRAWEVAAAYRLFNLARLTVGYQKWEFTQTGLDSSSAPGLQQDFEADVIYTELSFDIEDVSTLTQYFD